MNSNVHLADIAALARKLAPKLCTADPGAGPDSACDWYHGAWPTLRLVGTVSGIDGDADFYRTALSAGACSGDRVLITAAADHAMLERVFEAYRSVDAVPSVTVVDRCPTALELNRRHADAQGVDIECCVADIVTYRPDEPFDVVCTHSILSFIEADARDELYANWRGMLRPAGRLVLSQAVRPGYRDVEVRRFSRVEVESFVGRALQDGALIGDVLDMAPSDLAHLAMRFAERKTAQVVSSADVMKDGLERAGFGIAQMEGMARSAGYASASPDAPTGIVNTRVIAIAR